MKCNAERLSNMAAAADRIVSSRSASEASKCILLSGKTAKCTNNITFGSFDLPEEMEFEEDVLVNSKMFKSLTKSLRGDVDISTDDKSLILKDSSGVLKLPRTTLVMASPDAPPEEFVDAGDVAQLLSMAAPYAINAGALKSYQGVCLNGKDVVASDGKAMFHSTTNTDFGTERIIPIGEISHLPVGSTCQISSNERRVYFKYVNAMISTAVMNSKFVKYDQIIAIPYDNNIKVNYEDFSRAIKQSMSLSDEGSFIRVKLSVADSKMSISTATINGNMCTTIPVEGDSSWTVSINGFLVNKFLVTNDCEKVGISHYSQGKQESGIRFRGRLKTEGNNVFDVIISTCSEIKPKGDTDAAKPRDKF